MVTVKQIQKNLVKTPVYKGLENWTVDAHNSYQDTKGLMVCAQIVKDEYLETGESCSVYSILGILDKIHNENIKTLLRIMFG